MALTLVAVLLPILSGSGDIHAQAAKTLSQVKKIYVEPFGQDQVATRLRDRTVEELRKKGNLEVVDTREQSDAVVSGSGGIWLTGYVSTDPRSPSGMKEPVFQGFLSVEFTQEKDGPLWSYLVTPGKLTTGDIANELAGRLVQKFLDARKESEAAPAAPAGETSGRILLTASGSTFPAPLYLKWFESFHEQHPNVSIQYSPTGSSAGIESLLNDKVDFAGSDVPLSTEQATRSKRTILHFATVLGAVVPVYNLEGAGKSLNFTPAVLAGIYLGKIRKWSDPSIRASNPNAALPDADIVVVHRSDGSGTTFVWTDYLSKTNPEWQASIGRGLTVQWPVGMGATGNEGVASTVQKTPNAIGYVELEYALTHELSFGAVQNHAGKFIQADLTSVTATAMNSGGTPGGDSGSLITDAPGKNAYPLAAFTWWLVPQDIAGDKRAAIFELIQWMLSAGQKECSALAYSPLPRETVNQEVGSLEKLK